MVTCTSKSSRWFPRRLSRRLGVWETAVGLGAVTFHDPTQTVSGGPSASLLLLQGGVRFRIWDSGFQAQGLNSRTRPSVQNPSRRQNKPGVGMRAGDLRCRVQV